MSGLARRRLFQFRLATALVLMTAAGGLLLLNVDGAHSHAETQTLLLEWYSPAPAPNIRGWPFIAYPIFVGPYQMVQHRWNRLNLLYDVALAIGVLVAVAIISELIIR